MKIESAFRPLAEFEGALADLYSTWAEVMEQRSDHDAAFVFYKMSTEERGHASLVEYQRRLMKDSPACSRDIDVDVDLAALQTALDQVKILQGRRSLSSAEAISIALELERSAAETHFRSALRHADPELKRLLDCLGTEDRMHFQRLSELAARLPS